MSDDGVMPEEVARFVAEVWPLFAPDSVVIELLDWPAGAPFGGYVGWDGGGKCWRILAPRNRGSKHLLWCLFHELAHVQAGDFDRVACDFGAKRATLRGDPLARQVVSRDIGRAVATAGGRDREDRADRWAWEQTEKWWPTLREWKDGRKAAAAAWWVEDWKKTHNLGGGDDGT